VFALPVGTTGQRYAVVSCHVERPLDDAVWAAFERLQARPPGGFRVAALMRPPDEEAGEPEQRWLERAQAAAARAPFGLHTHWTSPTHARPTGGVPAERVREEIEWLRTRALEPRFFCGGGWYTDEAVRAVVREAGLVDCTATTFMLPSGGSRVVAGPEPGLLPATHTIGMAARAIRLPGYVHVYFHDTDLLDRKRAAALRIALFQIGLRRPVRDLDALAA
jgi:hypothetical protein